METKTIQALMSTTVENLAETQFNALRAHAIQKLSTLMRAIDTGDWQDAKAMLFESPAGDEMGTDNKCLNMAYVPGGVMDLGEIVDELERLYKTATQRATKAKK